MARFAKGTNALMISQRSGAAFPYNEMVQEWNGIWVHNSEFEPKQPQLEPKPVVGDPQGLQHANPARTEFYTPMILPNDAFLTDTTSKVIVNEPNHGRATGDAVRFRNLARSINGVLIVNIMPSTTLTAQISATDKTITVADTSAFSSTGYIVISEGADSNETIQYTGKTGTTFTGCVRGSSAPTYGFLALTTTASSHISGSPVNGSFIIAKINDTTYSFDTTVNSTIVGNGGGFPVFAGPVNNRG